MAVVLTGWVRTSEKKIQGQFKDISRFETEKSRTKKRGFFAWNLTKNNQKNVQLKLYLNADWLENNCLKFKIKIYIFRTSFEIKAINIELTIFYFLFYRRKFPSFQINLLLTHLALTRNSFDFDSLLKSSSNSASFANISASFWYWIILFSNFSFFFLQRRANLLATVTFSFRPQIFFPTPAVALDTDGIAFVLICSWKLIYL